MPFDENDEHQCENCEFIWTTVELDLIEGGDEDGSGASGLCPECGCPCWAIEGE